jgi:chemotaxis protein methyltransferase CheR
MKIPSSTGRRVPDPPGGPVGVALPTLSTADFQRLSNFLQNHLGITLNENKKGMLESRLLRRLRELGMTSFDEYLKLFFSSDGHNAELEHVVDLATTHHTFFFREEEHFTLLADRLVPDVLARKNSIRVWSAAASSGEEVYTIAMVLDDLSQREGFDYSVIGSDVSTKVLAKARRAVYDESAIENVPAEFTRRYLMRSRNRDQRHVRIVPELRKRVEFREINLFTPYQFDRLVDIAFVRNVIIYFNAEATKSLLKQVCAQLVPGGYVVLSLTESVEGLGLPLENLGRSIYRKRD